MIIVGFQYETDARRFWDAMRERLAEYSLSLHPEKTRLIEFGRFAADQRARRGLGIPETFNFLGFTFICGRSRRGRFALKRKSRGDRMRATLQEIKKEMQRPMHQPIPEQGKWLRQVATGFSAYHAVPTNSMRKRAGTRLKTSQTSFQRFMKTKAAWCPTCQVPMADHDETRSASRPRSSHQLFMTMTFEQVKAHLKQRF
jgi:hypothetical protein